MIKTYLSFAILLFALSANAQDYRYGKVSEEEVKSTFYEKDSSANAVVLYREQNIYYNFSKSKGFELVEEIFERVKIYNKEGFDWATRDIDIYVNSKNKESVSGLKGETYNIEKGKLISVKLDKDGIFEEQVNKYIERIKFTMPAIKAGSVIEFKYIRTSPFITSIDDIPLQYEIPIEKLDFQISIPEYYTFNTYFNPRSIEKYNISTNRSRGNYQYNTVNRELTNNRVNHSSSSNNLEFTKTNYNIHREDIPALKGEPFIDHLRNYTGYLKMELVSIKYPNSSIENYTENWEDVAKKIQLHSQFGDQLKKTNYFKEDLDSVLATKSGSLERIPAILEFVKSKVKWNDYFGYYTDLGVKDAYKEGIGNVADINLMLTSMLRYAGLDADPVLVSTKSNGVPVFPTRKGYNYVLASVKSGGKTLLLDATDKNSTPNILPDHAQNWLGRLVRPDGTSELINLIEDSPSSSTNVLKIQFEEDLEISGNFTKITNGHFAKEFREKHSEMSKENLLKEMEEGKGNIEILEVNLENEHDIYSDFKESFDFKLKNGVESINENVYITPLFFLAQNTNPFKSEVRKLPIFYKYPSIESKTVFIKIPETYKVESLPESKKINLNDGQGIYKFIILQSGNYIKISSEMVMKNMVYTPNDYKALKSFYDEMVALNSEAIVLSKI